MTDPITITSDTILDDVEHHFRITAGPGAGKTHWLVNHVQQVARIGKRLTVCSRIGVISYTNVAVREIVGRLGPVGDKTDVSTIHSFLYRNIVRPYLHFIKSADGKELVAHSLVDTHDVHFPAYDKVSAWAKAAGKGRILTDAPPGSRDRLFEQLRALTVRLDASGEPYLVPRRIEARDASLKELFTPDRLVEYKSSYWQEGSLDHEDVLYFAYRILRDFPALRRFLSDRFPYLFIDEFQDTVPVQGELVRWLAEAGTVIGVIGDPEQAIFSFTDALPEYFADFQLRDHRQYKINDNRRSTKSIVDLLNRVRTDGLDQKNLRADIGSPPIAYSGDLGDALRHARDAVPPGTPFLTLAWKRATLLQVRLQKMGQVTDPWVALDAADDARCRFLHCVMSALDLAQRRLFDLAITRLLQGTSSRKGFHKPIDYRAEITQTLRRSLALSLLEHLLPKHAALLEQTTLEFYEGLRAHMPKCIAGMKLPAVQNGKSFHNLASVQRYEDLFRALHTPDEARETRTIHQAKGSQCKAVFLVLGEEDQISHIVSPTANVEQQRLVYVALSRAEDYLFVYCPSSSRFAEFASLGMITHEV
jgi:DNA helicase-2/ATP-dependent DNA helicase PcrA